MKSRSLPVPFETFHPRKLQLSGKLKSNDSGGGTCTWVDIPLPCIVICCGANSQKPGTRSTRQTRHQARNQGGAFGAFATPEIFKTLHSKFDICRNFQRI